MNELMRLCVSNKAGHLDGTASLGESEIRRLASAGIRQFKLAGRKNCLKETLPHICSTMKSTDTPKPPCWE